MNMKKLIVTLFVAGALVVSVVQSSYAQKPALTIAPELYVSLNDGWNIGVGGILEAEWMVESKLGLTAGGGVGVMFSKYDFLKDYTFIPLKGGVKYHISDKVNLHANVGAAIGTGGYGTSALFGGGVEYNLNSKVALGARIEDAGPSYLGLKAAFKL